MVLDAITTPDIAPLDGLEGREKTRRAFERNRRSTFARTAKSALASWVKAGGKIEKLVPAEVRKDELQKLYQPAQQKARPIAERVEIVEKKFEALFKRMIDEDPDAAREELEALQARLTAMLPSLPPVVRSRAKVGNVTLHPH